ncbi:outer membrane beta-barrel protein [Flavobacterium gelatinilyticum]|uniref:outer membrane beta-barrel protein n=1 Tax=Flavobacterium gelatinilyticum TaxID=3003260 RepID=UPI0024804EBE|nr:outer membrane beta-barrel protein [Flavobacterium gelatinilyticum]
MKKLILLAFVLFIGFFSSNAQVTFRPGLRGGLGLSNLGGHGDFKPDFYVGAFGQINLTKRYSLQPEVTYSRQGANNWEQKQVYFNNDTYESYKISTYKDINIDYLSVAMINKFSFKTGFLLEFGPTLDFIVNTNLPYSNHDVDLGWVSGVGYKLPSGLLIEARFKANIINNYDSINDGYNYDENQYSPSITFQLGVSYTFGGK